MGSLEGKAALVTGGSRGIGAAVAEKLTALGAQVAVTYQNTKPDNGLSIQADSADPDAVVAAVEEAAAAFGRLDVLVNNAGVFQVGPLEDLGREEFDHTMAVNVRAPFLAARAAARHMREGGRIINLSSTAGKRGSANTAAYNAANFAVDGFTQALSKELAAKGITVNCVCPGLIETARMDPLGRGDVWHAREAQIPMGRVGTDEEVAELIGFLASPRSRYITGQAINVNGGALTER